MTKPDAFDDHLASCDSCIDLPGFPPCPTGARLRKARTAAHVDILTAKVNQIPGVQLAGPDHQGKAIVRFTAPGGIVGGLSYEENFTPKWMASVGYAQGGRTHLHGHKRATLDNLVDTATELLQAAQKHVCEAAAATDPRASDTLP